MTSYQAGDELQINDTTITLVHRSGFSSASTRWNWMIDGGALGTEVGEIWYPTAEEAIDNAQRTLGAPQCRHGQPTTQFCVDCHDSGR
jgi:hypothetical protein